MGLKGMKIRNERVESQGRTIYVADTSCCTCDASRMHLSMAPDMGQRIKIDAMTISVSSIVGPVSNQGT